MRSWTLLSHSRITTRRPSQPPDGIQGWPRLDSHACSPSHAWLIESGVLNGARPRLYSSFCSQSLEDGF